MSVTYGYGFRKYIFETSLNSVVIAKYVSKTGKIRLVAENNDNIINPEAFIEFNNETECSDFIDKKCDMLKNDQYYNTLGSLQSLIDAIV